MFCVVLKFGKMAPTDDEKRKNQDGPSPDRPKKRVNKPLIEKRRRERINECLNQLQTLISQLDKDKYKVGRPAKLEKADILEMTVEFVRKTKTNLQVNPKEDTDLHEQSYVAGYRKCMDEIQTFCKDNNVPTELKASLHDQIDLKIRQIKMEEDTAVDLSTKTDKKDSKLTEQMQVLANSNPAIQPKCLPQISTANSAQMTQVQFVQRPLNATNGQLTVVCQKEPSTYVLVPAATICQPIQIPSASQNLPVILQNGAQNCDLKSNMEKNGQIFPSANMLQNSGQLLMLPNSQFSIPMLNTSLSSNITLSSGYKPLPCESSLVVSTPHLPIVSSSLMSVSGVGIPTSSTHLMSTSGSPMFKQIQPSIPNTVNGQFHNITNELGNQIQNNDLNNDMWRPW